MLTKNTPLAFVKTLTISLFCVPLILFYSCSTAFLVKEQRVKYELTENEGITVSTLDKENYAQPVKLNNSVRIAVAIYVQNTGNSVAIIRLSEAKAIADDLTLPAQCVSQPPAASNQFNLVQNNLVRLSCVVIIDLKNSSTFQKKDQWMSFSIPFDRDGVSKSTNIVFHYKTKAEDFQ